MSAPLYAAIRRYLEKKRERLHMPGHKGLLPPPLSDCAPFDVTELPDTGCLYDGEGAPTETEAEFCRLYNSGATLLSAGGSTLCIQTMLSLFGPDGTKILMTRAAHHAAVNAAALLNLEPVWLFPDEATGVQTTGRISPAAVEAALRTNPDVSAVYLTSPDYFGTMCDISAIASVAHAFKKPLLVDNAHGAHLAFFEGLHPITLGADACCDSLHKTLPALTGAALLHLKDAAMSADARRRMAAFGSTSPSYLIMLSADLLLPRWQTLKADYHALAEQVALLRRLAAQKGVWATACDDAAPFDPVRIALLFSNGWQDAARTLLADCNIEAEYLSQRHIVLIPSPQSNLDCVRLLIERLPALEEHPVLPGIHHRSQPFMPLRKALLSAAEALPVDAALGRIAAAPVAPCPPGVALMMPGEILDTNMVQILNSAGIKNLFVVK